MLYHIVKYAPYRSMQVEAWDGKIIKATPALAWAIGKDIGYFLERSQYRGYKWYVIPESCRAPGLVDQAGFHSDAELFAVVSP